MADIVNRQLPAAHNWRHANRCVRYSLQMMWGSSVVFADGADCGRHSMLSDACHQYRPSRRRRRCVVTTYDLRVSSSPETPATDSPTTAERVDKSLTELGAHKAVGDGVTAGRDERQQVHVVHRSRRDVRHGVEVVEDTPRLYDVHRRPADEEENDDDRQHLDAASLGANAASTRWPRVARTDQLVIRAQNVVRVCRAVS